MDFTKLIRDPARIHNALTEVGNMLVAKQPISIVFPERYLDGYLAGMENDVRLVGIFGLVLDNECYATSVALAFINSDPNVMNSIVIDGEKYMELGYEKGDTIIKDLNLVRNGPLVYRVWNEFVTKGNIPPYVSTDDMAVLFMSSGSHGGVNLRVDNAILELITTSIARDPSNRNEVWRILTGVPRTVEPDYVPLNSVAYGATNTTAKLLGSHRQVGVTSALVSPSDRLEAIEELLRK